jgi:Ohr subfamily peroxiredoxin
MKSIYTTRATATGDGRNGRAETDDGLLAVDVRIPREMGGAGGATNPEQLFAAGYAACFHSALKHVGRADRADLTGSEVSATVGIGMLPAGGFGLTVALDVRIPSLEAAAAQALVHKAHAVCPYANAVKGNVDVRLAVVS